MPDLPAIELHELRVPTPPPAYNNDGHSVEIGNAAHAPVNRNVDNSAAWNIKRFLQSGFVFLLGTSHFAVGAIGFAGPRARFEQARQANAALAFQECNRAMSQVDYGANDWRTRVHDGDQPLTTTHRLPDSKFHQELNRNVTYWCGQRFTQRNPYERPAISAMAAGAGAAVAGVLHVTGRAPIGKAVVAAACTVAVCVELFMADDLLNGSELNPHPTGR